MSHQPNMEGQYCSLAHRQTFHPVFNLTIVSRSGFLIGSVSSFPEDANHGVCPNQGMNEGTKEIFRVGFWSLEMYVCINALIIPPLHPSILWWRARSPSKRPPVGNLYDDGRIDFLWLSWSLQVFDCDSGCGFDDSSVHESFLMYCGTGCTSNSGR